MAMKKKTNMKKNIYKKKRKMTKHDTANTMTNDTDITVMMKNNKKIRKKKNMKTRTNTKKNMKET